MESQIELNKERQELLSKYIQVQSKLMTPVGEVQKVAYRDGALSSKVKRLMAMAIALGVGCTNCILAQAMDARKAGASRDEILETLAVVTAIRGTTGIAESLRIVKLLEELGEL